MTGSVVADGLLAQVAIAPLFADAFVSARVLLALQLFALGVLAGLVLLAQGALLVFVAALPLLTLALARGLLALGVLAGFVLLAQGALLIFVAAL
ncbi:hypothetical protein CSC73_03590 [Pseudoxanthomonas sacheonensis]|nr:hypothetical protein CSC73_03590 [Pseudoxanthomonas sacheonensis]